MSSLLDHGYVRLIETWGSDERIVEAARMSTGGGFRGWPGDEKLLRYLWDHKHASPFEMAGMVLEVRAPLMVFREWHRHRTQSYNELSGRYVAMPDDDYAPTLDRVMASQSITNRQAQGSGAELTEGDAHAWLDELGALYDHAQRVYAAGDDEVAGLVRVAARDVVEVTGRGEAIDALVRVAGADRSAARVRDPVDSETAVAAVVRRHGGLPSSARL